MGMNHAHTAICPFIREEKLCSQHYQVRTYSLQAAVVPASSADPFRYVAYYAAALEIKIRRFPGFKVKFGFVLVNPWGPPQSSPCKMDRQAGERSF